MHRFACYGAVFALCLLASPAPGADTFSLKPGLWDFEMTSRMPTMPQPRTTKSSTCIEASATDPLEIMTRDSKCTVSKKEQSANTLRWEMNCPSGMPGQDMKGKGEITSDGSSATGKMEMSMSIQGREMTMSSTWVGKRTGDCKAP